MTFQIKNQLMTLLDNDAVAYDIAFDFVNDDPNKLVVFTNAYCGQQPSNDLKKVEDKAAAAKLVAEKRWRTMYPEA